MQTHRIIGIRHRVKKTVDGEARPTQVCVLHTDGTMETYDLDDEQAEFDWKSGKTPIEYRRVNPTDDLSPYAPRHLKTRAIKKGEDVESIPAQLLIGSGKQKRVVTHVPVRFDGLTEGDHVAMSMGGSGDFLANAIAGRAEERMGNDTAIFRIPPGSLNLARPGSKDDDAENLAILLRDQPDLFFRVNKRDRLLIELAEAYRAFMAAMVARGGGEQRLIEQSRGKVFVQPGGDFEEGDITLLYARAKASDETVQALQDAEDKRIGDLENVLQNLDVYREILQPIEGIGPRLSARLLASVATIRRFWVKPDHAQIEVLRQQARQLIVDGRFNNDVDKVEAGINRFQTLQRVRSWKENNGHTDEATLLTQAIACYRKIAYLNHKAILKGAAKFRTYCGAHLQDDGEFPRHRRGQAEKGRNNWSPDTRQGFYLAGEQWNKRPSSAWGIRLRANKVRLRERHPHVIKGRKWILDAFKRADRALYEQGVHITDANLNLQTRDDVINLLVVHDVPSALMAEVTHMMEDAEQKMTVLAAKQKKDANAPLTIWSDGHIHKTGLWRTRTQFCTWLYMQWTRLEQRNMAIEVEVQNALAEVPEAEEEIDAQAEVWASLDNANTDVGIGSQPAADPA